jgi:hypothetical protein
VFHRLISLAAAAIFAAEALAAAMAGTKDEMPAPPDRFVVTTRAGIRLTGPAARIEVRNHNRTAEPEVELFFSASGGAQVVWTAYVAAPPEFLETLDLTVPVVDRPLKAGKASVSATLDGAEVFAPRGMLQLHVQGARLVGQASGMPERLLADFGGPFVVTCAVPTAAMTTGSPAPPVNEGLPMLVVDETFGSALCQKHAALAGRSR